MSLIPTISNPFLGAFAGGLLYGLAVCTAACLPYVASYIAGIGVGFRKGIVVTLIFNSGRIAAYALIGCLVALFSGLFRLALSNAAISPFQIYSSLAFSNCFDDYWRQYSSKVPVTMRMQYCQITKPWLHKER